MLQGHYQLLKGYESNQVTIGFGSYGQVKLARNLKNNDIVAVKIIGKIAKNQVEMHCPLSHPHIIQLLDCQVDPVHEVTFLFLQYAEGGTLFDLVKMSSVPKPLARRYFRQVCEAVHYLHSKSIMHRDIKPQNILLKKGSIKLCDFGFAAAMGERRTLCGTYEYMSPEMIQNKGYDFKVDIWALGILLFEMIAGHAPFRGDHPEQVLQQMKTKIYFGDMFNESEVDLIKMILRVNPAHRPSVLQILAHPYLFIHDAKTKTLFNEERAKTVQGKIYEGKIAEGRMEERTKTAQGNADEERTNINVIDGKGNLTEERVKMFLKSADDHSQASTADNGKCVPKFLASTIQSRKMKSILQHARNEPSKQQHSLHLATIQQRVGLGLTISTPKILQPQNRPKWQAEDYSRNYSPFSLNVSPNKQLHGPYNSTSFTTQGAHTVKKPVSDTAGFSQHIPSYPAASAHKTFDPTIGFGRYS